MKAIQILEYGGPEVLRLVDVPPPKPAAGEVLVKIEAVGVGRPDVLLRTGVYKWKPPLPTVIGEEGAGFIEAVGEGVEGLAVGDKVLVYYAPVGSYAEYAVAPVKHVLKLPADFDLTLAVHLSNYISAYAILNDAARGVEPDVLYVNGAAGGVGTAVIQVAGAMGIKVIAGASSEEKCAYAQAQGAAYTVNYGVQAAIPEVLRLTDGKGVPLILDHLVGPRFTDSFEMLAPLGLIVSFNATMGFPADDLFVQMRANLANAPAVRCYSGKVFEKKPERMRQIQAAVVELFQQGRVKPPKPQVLPLAEARHAHELLDARKIMGKYMLAT